jgi:ubiquitin-conjugating enzyme E2 T
MGAPPRMHALRMARELQLLSSAPPPGVAAWPHDDARLDLLDAEIVGAVDTPYASGVFSLRVSIPPEYPLKPPGVRFVTKIYHPNIDSQGRICLDTLNMPPKGAWKPSLNIVTVLASVQLLMSHPNPEDGLMAGITDEYKRYPARFHATALDWTRKYATGQALATSGSPGDAHCTVEPTAATSTGVAVKSNARLACAGGDPAIIGVECSGARSLVIECESPHSGAATTRALGHSEKGSASGDISRRSTIGHSRDLCSNTRGVTMGASKASSLHSNPGPHPPPDERIMQSLADQDEITPAIPDMARSAVLAMSDGEEDAVFIPSATIDAPGGTLRRRLRQTGAERKSDDNDDGLVKNTSVSRDYLQSHRTVQETPSHAVAAVANDSSMRARKSRTLDSPKTENAIGKSRVLGQRQLPSVIVDLVDVDEPVVEEEAPCKLTRLKRRRL